MTPYWTILAIPAFLLFSPLRAAPDLRPVLYLCVALIYTLFIGLRHEIGADWAAYMRLYGQSYNSSAIEILTSKDIGYFFVNYMVSTLDGNIYIVNTICAAIFIAGLLLHCSKEPSPWLTLLIATPYLVFVVAMGYTRQGVAIGFELMAIHAVINRRTGKFILFILMATAFHKTAIILLPIGLMATQNMAKSSRGIKITLLTLFILSLPAALLFEQYLSLFEQYVTKGSESSGAYIRSALNILSAIIILTGKHRIKGATENDLIWRLLAMGAIVCGLSTPFASTAADRLGLYFFPIQLYALPRLLLVVKDSLGRTGLALILTSYSVATMTVWLKYSLYAPYWVPYKNVLLDYMMKLP